MKILLVNWQDIDNPQAGGAEIHLHEIFGRLAQRGHEITLLCGGWRGAGLRAHIDGMDVHRVGIRQTFGALAYPYYRRTFARGGWDLLLEDINKMPLYTPLWRARRSAALVPHLFGGTAFLELSAPLAVAVWISERPLVRVYRHDPFEVISKSTHDSLVEISITRTTIDVIYSRQVTNTYNLYM